MDMNHTTPHISPSHNKPQFPGYYALIPCLLLALIGFGLAVFFYIKWRIKLDELRHRLIPLYTYDPGEEDDNWSDFARENEEEDLAEPLYRDGRLAFNSNYGT